MYTEHVYTECIAERWAEKQVSDGGPCSLYKHLQASTVPVYCQTLRLSKVCHESQQKRCNSLKLAQIQKCQKRRCLLHRCGVCGQTWAFPVSGKEIWHCYSLVGMVLLSEICHQGE